MTQEVQAILDRIEQMEADNAAKYDELKKSFDTIINGYKDSEDKFNRSEFATRNGEALGKYADTMKKLNGDDFDLVKEAYDEYHNGDYDDMEEAEYIAKLVATIDEKLNAMKAALGAEDVEVKADEGEPTEVKADEEPVAEAADSPEEEEKVEDEHTSDEMTKTAPAEATGRVSKERRDNLGDWGKKPRKTSDEDAKEAPVEEDDEDDEEDEKAKFEKYLEDYAKNNPEFNRIVRK